MEGSAKKYTTYRPREVGTGNCLLDRASWGTLVAVMGAVSIVMDSLWPRLK